MALTPTIRVPEFHDRDFFLVAIEWDTGRYAHKFLEWVGLSPNDGRTNVIAYMNRQSDIVEYVRGRRISHVWVPRPRTVPSLRMYDNFQMLKTMAGSHARFFYEDS